MLSLNEYKDIITNKISMIGQPITFEREVNRKSSLANRYSDVELEEIIINTENFIKRITPSLLSISPQDGYVYFEFEPSFKSIYQTITYNDNGGGDEVFSLDDDPTVLYSIGILQHILSSSIITKTVTQERIPGIDKAITGKDRVVSIPKIIMTISNEDLKKLMVKYNSKQKSK